MNKRNLVISQWVHPEIISKLDAHFNVISNPDTEPWDMKTYEAYMQDAHVLMAFMPDRVDKHFLDKAPSLEVIGGCLKGYDNFDLDEIKKRGIEFFNVPDILSRPTAELALTLTLTLLRNVIKGDDKVRSGAFMGWRPVLYGDSLFNKKVGIMGMGAVARELVPLLQAFSCEIYYYDKVPLSDALEDHYGVRYRELDELVENAHILYPLLHLYDKTYHLVDESFLKKMPENSYLINVGRGSVVNEKDVLLYLENGHLSGYAADVFEMEDWAITNRPKEIYYNLRSHPNTVFTPHLGSAVCETRKNICIHIINKILSHYSL
jgi:phosphonate dehydrogenase